MTVMLVDAAGLYFRAFYGVPDSVRTPDGKPINAVRGYLDMTATLLRRRRPERYVACLDLDWRPGFRVAAIASYKAHRVAADGFSEEVPAELIPQVPVLLEVLAALGLATAGAPGFEADDVIATLAATGRDCEVVTGDRDLLALASDSCTVLYTGRGMAKMEEFGPQQVLAKYGVPPEHYPDFAALRGDPSDGLAGIAGVGEKTAATLVQKFGAIESIVSAAEHNLPDFPAGSRAKILAGADYLAAAATVVRPRTDVPLAEIHDAIPTHAHDEARLVELCDSYGLDSAVNRVLSALQECQN